MAFEIAQALAVPLDVFVVRKLGVPGHEELALGAIASGGARVVNRRLVEELGIPSERVEAIEAEERRELARRERDYRGERPALDLGGRTVILVDDGLATGASMLAAIRAVQQEHPTRLVVAVPVARQDVCAALGRVADEVVCLRTPAVFRSVGTWFDDFSQTRDDEVRSLLARARQPTAATLLDAIRELTGTASDCDPLVERATASRIPLIGEDSHGSSGSSNRDANAGGQRDAGRAEQIGIRARAEPRPRGARGRRRAR